MCRRSRTIKYIKPASTSAQSLLSRGAFRLLLLLLTLSSLCLRHNRAARHRLLVPSVLFRSLLETQKMAESFIGKWKVDLASTTGLDDFGAAIGFSAERIEKYRTLVYTIEFSKSGDTFTATVSFDAEIPAQTYSFKLGETFDYNSIDGTKPKLTITMDGGKVVESYKLEEKDREWQTIREVSDSVMTSTTSYGGKSVVQKLNKQ